MVICKSLYACALKSHVLLFSTMVLKPVYAWFRQQNMRCSYYIDDSLNMDKDRAVCQNNTSTMVKTLESLGFTINYKQEGQEALNRSPEYTGQRSNI